MVDVTITYEALFDLLRRETKDELQKLDDSFYEDVRKYINQKKQLMEENLAKSDYFSKSEAEKIELQLKNIRKILVSVYELREKKIIHLALNKARTESTIVNTDALLSKEQDLFNALVVSLTRGKEQFFSAVDLERPMTSMRSARLDRSSVFSKEDLDASHFSSQEESRASVSRSSTPESAVQETKPEVKEASTDITIKFLTDLPRFKTADGQIMGPFTAGNVAPVPETVANILISKKRAELV
ncbi:MAG: DNA replication complex GINS family protein [Candidatus Woesearchaeota archaeon]|nr:MAG: DNA replication complex GINS family protein [Candidatus Woesearchaeota archaeon]